MQMQDLKTPKIYFKQCYIIKVLVIVSRLACWNTIHLSVPTNAGPFQIFESFRDQLQLPFFMEIVVTICWSIWSVRNDVIFINLQASVQRCKAIIKNEFAQVILRARTTYHPLKFSL
jgi:hypothetical protein